MRTMPNAKQAEAYINDLTDLVSVVNDFRSTSGPGNIQFPVYYVEWPNYPNFFYEIMRRITMKLGEPVRRGDFYYFIWRIDKYRSVRIWEMPSVRAAFFIGLMDEEEI